MASISEQQANILAIANDHHEHCLTPKAHHDRIKDHHAITLYQMGIPIHSLNQMINRCKKNGYNNNNNNKLTGDHNILLLTISTNRTRNVENTNCKGNHHP